MKKIVLFGYYGHQNFGDDLMLYSITEELGENNELHILTSDVDKTYIGGENVFLHQTFKNAKIKNFLLLMKVFMKKDYLVWGGGTCFSDQDGVVNPSLLFLAKAFGLKVVFIGIGANIIKKKSNVIKMRLIGKLVDKVYVRDSDSLEILRTFFKPSLLEKSEDLAYLYQYKKTEQRDNKLIISLRDLTNYLDKGRVDMVLSNLSVFIASYQSKYKFEKVIILNLDDELDFEINQRLYNRLQELIEDTSRIIFITDRKLEEKIKIIQSGKLNIIFRLHGIFISVLSGVDTIGISYSPKVKRFMDSVKARGYVELIDIINNKKSLEEAFERMKIIESVSIDEKINQAFKNFNFLKT